MTIGATLAVGFTLGALPIIGGTVTHFVERFSTHIKSKRELDARAVWYKDQIAATLGINPDKVRGRHLVQAAALNPQLAAAVKDVTAEQAKENKSSMLVNGAVALIPMGTTARNTADAVVTAVKGTKAAATGLKHMGKVLAASTAGGLLASWTSKDILNAQEVLEGIAGQLAAAREGGTDPRTAVTPQMLFLFRVVQDEALSKQIAEQFKKPFHQMKKDEQLQVMEAYPALARAAESEAEQVIGGTPVQELMATRPDLSNMRHYQTGEPSTGFVAQEMARRNMQNNVRVMRPNGAANDASFAGRVTQQRLASASASGQRQA